MGDYFAHWLKMGKAVRHAPHIFRVNWFRKDARGKYIWPGFGENMRVLEWIVGRCHGLMKGVDTPLGIIPAFEDLNWRGLERFTREQYQEIVRVDGDAWKDEVASHDELLGKLGARLPRELELRRTQLHQKLAA
jgi:phosphoenolpyruvate carboxykinase (GTP)